MYHSIIRGLVIRDSARNAESEPIGERASSMLWCPVLAGPYAATKPKARSPMGFLLCAARLVSDAECAVLMRKVLGILGCGQAEVSAKARKVPAFCQKPGNRQPRLRRGNSGTTPAPGPRQTGPTYRDSKPELQHRPASLTNLSPVPHTTARACMGRVGVNTERDDSANTENKALHGACGVGRAAQSTNEPSKADIRGVGTYAQSSQLLKSSGFDSVFCVSSSKVGAGMQGDQPTHALVDLCLKGESNEL